MRLRFSEYAATLAEAEEKAKLTAAKFFDGRAFDLAAIEGYGNIEIRTGTGEISYRAWKVDFEATECLDWPSTFKDNSPSATL